jgi:CubicO group peptidase (beta-lactamase class C family)
MLTASAVNAQSKNASEYAQRLDSFIEETLREKKIPRVAVGIVEDGRLVYARGYLSSLAESDILHVTSNC